MAHTIDSVLMACRLGGLVCEFEMVFSRGTQSWQPVGYVIDDEDVTEQVVSIMLLAANSTGDEYNLHRMIYRERKSNGDTSTGS
jgi:hypothetical protein